MKRPLIIGNALLFAACLTSCDDEAPEDPGLIDCGCIEDQFMNLPDEGRDDMAVADMAEADMAEADMSVALDMAPEATCLSRTWRSRAT